jgi:DNA-binding SARP family transcriptional activator/tetratricopeptide (TPR) repeat protein
VYTEGFGARLRAARLSAGLTQRELAAAAGMSLAAVRDLEQGRSLRPRPRSVETVIAALGLRGSAAEVLRESGRAARAAEPRPREEIDGPLRIEILGDLVARRGPVRLQIGRGKRLAMLGRLALTPNVPVSIAELCELLWGGRPPESAMSTLQLQLSRLRAALGHDGGRDGTRASGRDGGTALIPRTGSGYALVLSEDALDLGQFRRSVLDAQRTGSRHEAADTLEAALRLWRGEVLADVPELRDHALVEQVIQEHLAAVVRFADLAYETGDAARALPTLHPVVAAHALHEPLQARFIRGLAASGRSADALLAYEEVRRRLTDELGVDPGAELATTHLQILRGQIAPQRREPGTETVTGPLLPAQLPADIAGFTGRGADLAGLDALVGSSDGPTPATTVPVVVVCGTAGVGKTALAVRWAHTVRDRFPDGQLYVNMRGYDYREPITVGAALAGFLRAFGVDERTIPADVDERAARFRSELSGRRVLVVVDNAASADQVRPLLPGSPTCAAVVTSRDSLAGLTVCDGARRLELGLLPATDATALLRALIGARADAEPDALAALVTRCARLPLALRIAAELATARPHSTLDDLVRELTDRRQRLDHLDSGGDQHAAVTAVFSWSLRHLAPATARLFGLLGQHPGGDIDVYAAAALADVDVGVARRELDALKRAHLLEPTGADRYGMHDLLHAYARTVGPDDRAALGRLFDFYVATAMAAILLISPAEARRARFVPAASAASAAVPLADAAAAVRWLDRERANLIAATGHTARHGWPVHAIELSGLLDKYLLAAYPEDGLVVHRHADHAAALLDDSGARGRANLFLSSAHQRLGHVSAARAGLDRAIAMYRRAGDAAGQSRALTNLGNLEKWTGSYRRAAEHHLAALALLRQTDDRNTEAGTLTNLGTVYWRQGRFHEALDCHTRALTLFREVGDRHGEAGVMTNLGDSEAGLGNYDAAVEHYQRGLALNRNLGSRYLEGSLLDGLGGVSTVLGDVERAADCHRRALDVFRDIRDRRGEASALNGLAEAACGAGDVTGAGVHHRAALEIAEGIDVREQAARAHAGLGLVAERLDDLTAARQHYATALRMYRELDSPEAERIAALIDAV